MDPIKYSACFLVDFSIKLKMIYRYVKFGVIRTVIFFQLPSFIFASCSTDSSRAVE